MSNHSPFHLRGVVEGFYGVYYTFPQRNELLRFLSQHGYNFYVYGPKNDRQHRMRWREPYPPEIVEQFAENIATAQAAGITFCYSLSPGVSIQYSLAEDFASLTAKLRTFYDLGVRAFSLFLDDIAAQFLHASDRGRYPSYAAAHVDLCNRTFEWLKALDPAATLSMCPTDYHGRAPFSPYLRELGEGLHADIGVFYTGPEICSPAVTVADMRAFAEALQRPPILWDNYPVNDLAMQSEMHIGPVRGRDDDLYEVVAGVVVNTMNQLEASKIPLLTYADYLADPIGYDPDRSWEAALSAVADAASVPALRRFAENSTYSCLQPAEAEELARRTGAALAALQRGEGATRSPAVQALLDYLNSIDEAIYHLRNRMHNLALRADLLPWLELLEYWYLLGKRGINVLEALDRGEAAERPLSLMEEAWSAIRVHPKRIAGQALLPLAEYVMAQTERVRVTMAASTPLIRTARQQAEAVLLANGGPLGLVGANQAYQQVWSRDSMICGLGLWLTDSPDGPAINRRSLETLRQFQSPLGKIPHNVGFTDVPDPALVAHGGKLTSVAGQEGMAVEDTAHAGVVDGNLWYIVGHYYHFLQGRDAAFLSESWESLQRALLWLRYQDSNECGLLEVHEAMDWADLFANRYNVLFDNVLYFAAWKCMAQLAMALGEPGDEYARAASDVQRKINLLLWVGPEVPKDYEQISLERREWVYPLKRVETELVQRPFYLPYMAFRDYADRFDTLGNLLAILFGVADQTQANKILDYIHGVGLNEPYPVQALYPPIHPGEKDWREYYRVRNLNQPHHYHNGGAWPFIGGFYVAALVQAGRTVEAAHQLEKLTDMVRQGRMREWEFNEWFHGTSGRPMGFAGQSWSAGMYLYAQDAVRNGRPNIFNRDNGWSVG